MGRGKKDDEEKEAKANGHSFYVHSTLSQLLVSSTFQAVLLESIFLACISSGVNDASEQLLINILVQYISLSIKRSTLFVPL